MEISSAEADALLERHFGELTAPDLFSVEVASALVRKANMDKPNRSRSEVALARLDVLLREQGVLLHRTASAELAVAANLALDLGHPLKDCIYLALAMELNCELVTCDARFAAKAHDVWPKVRLLGA